MSFRIPLSIMYIFAASLSLQSTQAITEGEINLNRKYIVGGISEFDRQKFITVHSALTEPDWDGEEDKLDYLINDLDVYFGRDNGIMILHKDEVAEDPERPGYADPYSMKTNGQNRCETVFSTDYPERKKYEPKNDVMIGGQTRAFWADDAHEPDVKKSWNIAGADAAGEFMGRFLNEHYRKEGESADKGLSRPKYIEVLNEPLYELIDGHKGSTVKPIEIFEYHNEVATAIRRVNDTALIGGYTAAFPIFEERNFARWDERMKLFIDTCGEHMDFISVHFYDFNDRGYKGRDYYKGSRIEATLDMMEQYTMVQLGEVTPFIISEYGGRDHKLERGAWSPLRDWHFMKAFSPLMLTFMDRPNMVLKALPFIVVKAEWGRKDGKPYNWRLLRQAKEADGETGDEWVFTEQIKFYELWSDVNGTRVATSSGNPDVIMDAYVDGNKAYIILSNLSLEEESVQLNLLNNVKTGITSAKVKHLHLVGDKPELDIHELKNDIPSYTLGAEATAIIEYTFTEVIDLDQAAEETKHYATDYNKAIEADETVHFNINGVKPATHGNAILNVSFGRELDRTRQPNVLFNGTPLMLPASCGGDTEQPGHPAFFGMLELSVPYELLRNENTISITFPDSGGRVSSVTLKDIHIK